MLPALLPAAYAMRHAYDAAAVMMLRHLMAASHILRIALMLPPLSRA